MFHPQVCSQLDVTFPSIKWGSEGAADFLIYIELHGCVWSSLKDLEDWNISTRQWKLENRSYVGMKSWKAKKKSHFCFSLFSELWPAAFVFPLSSNTFCLHSENNVLSPQYLLLSVLIFPCVFCGVSQCWYFSKVCSEHTRRGWNLPGSCSSVITHPSGHNKGRGKKEIIYILWKNTKCVQCFQFLVVCPSGSCCHIPYARNLDGLPGAQCHGGSSCLVSLTVHLDDPGCRLLWFLFF